LGSAGFDGKPLSGNKTETGYTLHFEFEVLSKLGK
jgi:hypothetical protein